MDAATARISPRKTTTVHGSPAPLRPRRSRAALCSLHRRTWPIRTRRNAMATDLRVHGPHEPRAAHGPVARRSDRRLGGGGRDTPLLVHLWLAAERAPALGRPRRRRRPLAGRRRRLRHVNPLSGGGSEAAVARRRASRIETRGTRAGRGRGRSLSAPAMASAGASAAMASPARGRCAPLLWRGQFLEVRANVE